MPDHLHAPHLPRQALIDAYGNGGFRFAGLSHRGSLLCLPSGIWAWAPAAPAEIDEAALLPVFAEAAALIDAPWAMAAIPDFLHPKTRGQRPEHFFEIIRFRLALTKLGAQDPSVHRLNAEVQHLLKPRSVYQDPELVQRVMAMMAD